MKSSSGFSLVELMITLVLGLVISGAVIQVLVSSNITNTLNQAVSQVQESGRFITHRLTQELLERKLCEDTLQFSQDGFLDKLFANILVL